MLIKKLGSIKLAYYAHLNEFVKCYDFDMKGTITVYKGAPLRAGKHAL